MDIRYGLYPTYASDTDFRTYEGMLDGQRHAIAFRMVFGEG